VSFSNINGYLRNYQDCLTLDVPSNLKKDRCYTNVGGNRAHDGILTKMVLLCLMDNNTVKQQ
jgi:hypothetical protein